MSYRATTTCDVCGKSETWVTGQVTFTATMHNVMGAVSTDACPTCLPTALRKAADRIEKELAEKAKEKAAPREATWK